MSDKTLHIGIIGAGGFAHFAAAAFTDIQGVHIVAVMDTDAYAANELAAFYKASAYSHEDDFLKHEAIDLVYIATPPYLHYSQSKLALRAGKHVICEKPAALHVFEAEELVKLAATSGLLYVVNLMQRYNPLFNMVKSIVNEKPLGNFLHGFFENYASNERMKESHWFWDVDKSGGIFIEHGVHFFDLFEGWFGTGEMLHAFQLPASSGKGMIDRVQATVIYQEAAVNYYHGFNQPDSLDRQELRLQFEKGDVTLYGWVPVEIKIYGLLQSEAVKSITAKLGGFSMRHHSQKSTGVETFNGNVNLIPDQQVTIQHGNLQLKQARYRQLLISMLVDQWSWICDRNHVRVIDEGNAVRSLEMAEQAFIMSKIDWS